MELKSLRVDLPKDMQIGFNIKCTQNETTMTTVIKKFISLYLSDNEVLMPLLSE